MLPFEKILVPIDYSLGARHALEVAVGLSRRTGTDPLLLHVIAPLNAVLHSSWDDRSHAPDPVAAAKKTLHDFARSSLPGTWDPVASVRLGLPADQILLAAEAHDVDLIVMGTHGRPRSQSLVLGSVAAEVLRRSRRPLLTVRERPAAEATSVSIGASDGFRVRSILVPIDFSPTARLGLELALEMASELSAEVHLVHVVDMPMRSALDLLRIGRRGAHAEAKAIERKRHEALDSIAREREQAGSHLGGSRVSEHVLAGQPATEIAALVERLEIDIVIIGSQGRSGLADFLLGSTAERVLRTASCPVLTVHGSGALSARR